MRRLTVADVEWSLVCEREDVSVRGNALASGDEGEDDLAEAAIIADIEAGNEWAWCTVVVAGRYKGLEAHDALGCCSYASEADFKQSGGCYDDMRAGVLDELQGMAEELCDSLKDEAECIYCDPTTKQACVYCGPRGWDHV